MARRAAERFWWYRAGIDNAPGGWIQKGVPRKRTYFMPSTPHPFPLLRSVIELTRSIARPGVPGALKLVSMLAFGGLCFAQSTPPFLSTAATLMSDLQKSALTASTWPNVYGTPASIVWAGSQSTATTECSSFVTQLWSHTYGWNGTTFKSWMGQSSPNAAQYHDAIAQQNGFTLLRNISQIAPGDIIAIAYYPEYQSPSGHVMIVQAPPQANSSKPIIANTYQWTLSVIDSSSSYHGTGDTRYAHPGGIGQGTFRLYTNPDGTVAGYTWSLLSTSLSTYYPQATTTATGHHLVIGRLTK